MGGLGKHAEKIDERRLENGAQIVFEYQYPQPHLRRAQAPDTGDSWQIPRDEIAALRKIVPQIMKECEERLSQEMTVVYGLNEDRTRIWLAGYMTKGEASRLEGGLIGGLLLDLDVMFGGIHLFGDHLFVSEKTIVDALAKYGDELTHTDLIVRVLEDRRADRERRAA